MSLNAFGPRGLTFNLAANTTASAPLQIPSNPPSQYTYQFINTGSNAVWFAYSTQKGNNAALPTPGSPACSICVLPNEIVIYSLCPNAYISVICQANTSNLEVSPGEGM